MALYRVSADIEYLDGNLAGLVLPSGYGVMQTSRFAATKLAAWVSSVIAADDFVRAAITGNRYKFRSAPRVDAVRPVL
jgi:hypothetical protein